MYSGYLLKIGNYTFPRDKIAAKTYHAAINSQDNEPYTDGNGYLHRNAVDLKAITVEFDTIPLLTNSDLSTIVNSIRSQYSNTAEKRVVITAYIPELDDYLTQTGYMVDLDPTMYFADNSVIKYEAVRFKFVGGVYEGEE